VLKALTVRGPFRGPTGYDHHVREFVRELHTQGIAIELQDLPNWSPARLPTSASDHWFESLNQPCGAQTVLHFCMPHQVIASSAMVHANYTMFEADRVPPFWVEANRKHDVLIVPTESSKRAWVASGMPAHRVQICPLGVNPAVFSGEAKPLKFTGWEPERYRVRFLNVSESSARKNLLGLLETWLKCTSRLDDAVLIIKIGFYAPGEQERFDQNLSLLEDRLGKRMNEAALVHLIHDMLPDAAMPELYAAATHYISMSHGEGWDNSMMEAAASGLKLIAPRHSAYLAYLDSSIASLIDSREIAVQYEGDPATAELFRGAHWWQPDQEQAIHYIREAIEGLDTGKISPRDRVVRDFSWAQSTRRLVGILDETQSIKAKIFSRKMATEAPEKPSLLYVSPVVPSATGSGIAMRAGMVLEALCARYRVSLVAISLYATHEEQLPEFLRRQCESVAIFPPSASRVAAENGPPFDVVHVFRLAAMEFVHPYLRQVRGRARLHLDLDDIESKTNRRIAELHLQAGNYAVADQALANAQRSSSMEAVAFRLFDRIYVCSESDRSELSERCQAEVRVLRNAVRLPPAVSPSPSPTNRVFRFLFVGTLGYYPNQNGVRFFCTQVLPFIRERARIPFEVNVVGSGESTGLRDLACGEVRLAGPVADLHRWYEECDAVIVPLRAGGGTRVKILEAFSYLRPVVTTTLGLEGIEAVADRHALVADAPEEFAAACLQLMSDPVLAQVLVANARALVSQSYTIESLITSMGLP
jgi:glycosyltransferase involved in cell wall biosynthesis